ncbi:aldo/keto reductase [Streptomyces olindensis]|uniref:aldo/keto reductase n=1 Tax=Streptomyces olindensis TaxID=358823 RepID=UPI0036637566
MEATEALARLAEDNGMTLIEMAIAFTLNHPSVTSALIGPRTLQHLRTQLPAADVTLDAAVLDRIDELVTPGTVINPADSSFVNPALQPEARRR